MSCYTKTVSLTFGDVAENHKGMQKIGNLSDNGFNFDDSAGCAKYTNV
jgi:hypothetical protein